MISKEFISVVSIIIILIIIMVYLYTRITTALNALKFKKNNKETSPDTRTLVNEMPPIIQNTQNEKGPKKEICVYELPTVAVVKSNPKKEFEDIIKSPVPQGYTPIEFFYNSFERMNNKISFEDALDEAIDNNFKAADIALIMDRRNYSFEQITESLNNGFVLNTKELVGTLIPITKENSIKEKMSTVVKALCSTCDLDGEEESVAEILIESGCSQEEALEIIYNNLQIEFGKIISAIRIKEVETIAALAQKLNIDLIDDNEYESLRDAADIKFSDATKILKKCGKSITEILNIENSYNELSLDDLEEIIITISGAGFTNQEIVNGVMHAEFTSNDTCGAIVKSLYENKIPIDDIVSILQKEETSPDDLDEELRDEDLAIRDRVIILYNFLKL